MVVDPFLEAGIDIPKELPYQTPATRRRKISTTSLVGPAIDENGGNKSRAQRNFHLYHVNS